MMDEKAPIDGFGIGVNLDARSTCPSLDCAYKLQEYAGTPRRKLSEGKVDLARPQAGVATLTTQGRMHGDILSLETDTQSGETLIAPVMRRGKRIAPAPTLAQIREHAAHELARLPEPLRQLKRGRTTP